MTRPPVDQLVTFLYAVDAQASWRFYEDLLALPLVLDQGACRIYRVAREGFLGVCRSQGERPAGGVIVTLVSADVDGWYRALCAKGVAFEQAPTHNRTFDIYHCLLRDPAGYLVEIQSFRDPAWPHPQA